MRKKCSFSYHVFFLLFFFLRLPIELEALKIPPETNEKPLIMPGIFKVFSVRMSCCSWNHQWPFMVSLSHSLICFLFQGTYSSHGVELVMVTHSPADHKIVGTKITVWIRFIVGLCLSHGWSLPLLAPLVIVSPSFRLRRNFCYDCRLHEEGVCM